MATRLRGPGAAARRHPPEQQRRTTFFSPKNGPLGAGGATTAVKLARPCTAPDTAPSSVSTCIEVVDSVSRCWAPCIPLASGVSEVPRPPPPPGGGFKSPKRLCIYSLLSVRGRYPRREQSAHVGASPPLPRSLGYGGGRTPPKGMWPPAEPPTPCVPPRGGCATALCFSLLSTSRPRPRGGEACVRIRC
jgi:hypothetical protein